MSKAEANLPFTADAVRAFPAAAPSAVPNAELNPFATQVAGQYKSDVMSPDLLCGLWRVAEFAVLALVAFAVIVLYEGSDVALVADTYALASLAAAAFGVVGIQIAGGYSLTMLRERRRQLLPILLGWGGSLAAVAVGVFFLKAQDDISRVWLAGSFAGGLAALALVRVVLGAKIRRWARNGVMERRAVIVGGGAAAETLIRGLEAQPESDIRICGIFDDRDNRRSPAIVAGYPKLGTVRELVDFARLARIDMLIVTLPLSAERRVLSLLKELWVLPLDIRLSAYSAQLRFRPRSYSFVGQIPLLDVFDRPLADWDRIAKRAFDLVVASCALIALAPVFAATALAVKLDSKGPVFFRQKRHGFNNQVIEVFKFRSMFHEMSDPAAAKIVTKGDPRVTRVGRFIRKTSLDELPQLWNVIRGELSLVGPRPHAVHAISSQNEAFVEIVEGYFGRHKVKPGITGWAQIKGYRGEVDGQEKLKKRVEHDLHYIENWSILFDIWILAKTPISLLKTENAY